MASENSVILHGSWTSTYVSRVELALKIKGIPFDYVQEDLLNKSELLLKYNPVHKKVPVLVHNGKPIAESLVILEYIDETWKNEPRLLPEDPYERAQVRFWAGYFEQVLESARKVFISDGKEAEEKACQDLFEKFDVLEEGMKKFFSGNPRSINRDNLNLLDIMMFATFGAHKAHEEFFGFKILDPQKHPLIFQWVTTLMELPVVKEITPPHEAIVSFLQRYKQIAAKFLNN